VEPSDPVTIFEADLVTAFVANADLVLIALAVGVLVWAMDVITRKGKS
jgi:flagellar biosynthesis protein FliQ